MENKNQISTGGFIPVYRQFILDSDISPTEKTVYLVTRCKRYEKTGLCYPSVRTIAKDCGLQPRTIQRCLVRLESKGWIVRQKNAGRTNLYLFPKDTTPVSRVSDSSDTRDTTPLPYKQEVDNKQYKNKARQVLYHGRDKCYINQEGRIMIMNGGSWKEYAGGDDERFRYGELRGIEAKLTVIGDCKKATTPSWTNHERQSNMTAFTPFE